MNLQLEDKTALVSGSSQGIGFAIAEALAKEGAAVVINSNKQDLENGAWRASYCGCGRPFHPAGRPRFSAKGASSRHFGQ